MLESTLKEKILSNFFSSVITPIVEIEKGIYAKVESSQKTGSVKDRFVLQAVKNAVKDESIKIGTTLVEATSGNTGISLAAAGAFLGLKVIIVMPSNMSEERKSLMKMHGAEIIEVGPSDFLAAIQLRDGMLKNQSSPQQFWSPRQFENNLNVKVHEDVTGPEIADQMTAYHRTSCWDFVAGSGTGGTLMGISNFMRKTFRNGKAIRVVPAEGDSFHGIQGINDGKDFLLDTTQVPIRISVTTQEAIDAARWFSKTHGMLVGISSGANLVAARKRRRENGSNVVTMLCDRGERYFSIFKST